MQHLIEIIENEGVPTTSAVDAAQYLGLSGQGIGQQKDSYYINIIKDLTGTTIVQPNSDILRITTSHLICTIVELTNNESSANTDALLKMSEERANKMFNEHPWLFAKPETDAKLDSNGQVKAKKGSKKILAQKVYDEQIKGKNLSRKESIAILVEAGVSTPAGSSTYYAKLKKGEM